MELQLKQDVYFWNILLHVLRSELHLFRIMHEFIIMHIVFLFLQIYFKRLYLL